MITLLRMCLFLIGLWCLSVTGAGYFLRAHAQQDDRRLEASEQAEPRESIRIEQSPVRHSLVSWQTCQIVRNMP